MFRTLTLYSIILTSAIIQTVNAVDGESVYKEHCASCHDAGVARAPSFSAMKKLTAESIVQSLETGVMRVIGQWNINGPERVAVAEYLSGKTFDSNWQEKTTLVCNDKLTFSAHPLARPHWNGWGVDHENTRFQSASMAGIDKSQMKKLRLDWVYAFPGETVVESPPTIIDGKMFIGSRSGRVYAFNASTGCSFWTYQAGASIKNAIYFAQIGPEAMPMLFFGDIAGWIYGLNAKTGELVWKIRADEHPAARIVGGIQIEKDSLYIGVSSLEEGLSMDPDYSCCSFRGSVLRIDAGTGRVVWQTYTIEEEATPRGENQYGKEMSGPSGASIWSAVTLDTKLRRLYVATSDNYSHPATDSSDSILGLSMETGKIEWIYQGLAGDVWNSSCHGDDKKNCPDEQGPDEDMGSSPMLIELSSGQRLLAAGQKTGVLHVLDPDQNGKLLWQKKVAEGGILGGIEWGPATDGRRFYVAKAEATWKDQRFLSSDTELNPYTGGGLVAIDAASQEVVWEAPPLSCEGRSSCSPAQTAAVSGFPGVILSGSLSGVMQAFDADTGEILWSYDTVREYESINGARAYGGAIDGPGPVIADGWIYVTSGYAKFGGLPGNVLLAFRPAE